MARKKHLVVAVEGTAALGRYWRTIFSDYLQKLIRSFCRDEEANSDVQLALVQFNVHGVHSSCLVQRSAWVRNVDYFLELLAAIDCSGGGFCDAAIAEGLSEALMMFLPPNGGYTQQTSGFGRHCILVAASNPYPLPTLVYRPPDDSGRPLESCLSDAETLVKSFPLCFVSLSVICPRQLPKLKSIYNAGKRNLLAADHTIDIVTNSHYIVLISDDFVAACADLSQSEITTLPSNQQGSDKEAASVSGSPSTIGSHVALTSAISNVSMNSSPTKSQPLELREQLSVQSGTSINQNKMKGVVLFDTLATGTIMPAASALQSAESGYVKLWEGNLTCLRKGQTVYLTKLQTYRKSTASALLAEDWPSTMHVYQTIHKNSLKKQKFVEKAADRLAFVAMNQNPFLEKLNEKNVCAVIDLPSQKLVLSVSDAASVWVGTLYPNRKNLQTSGSNLHGHNGSQRQQRQDGGT